MVSTAPASALVAVLVVRLFDESAVFLPSGALESFRSDLGLTYAEAGTVLALIAPGAVAGTVFTAAADRYSRRVIAAGGAFALAVSLAVFGTGGSFLALGVASLVMGAATTAMVDASEVALVDLAGDDLRSFLARSNLLAAVGDLVGPALVACAVLAGLSWRAGFGVGALFLVLYGVALALAPLPPPPRRAGTATPGQALARVCRDRRVWLIGLVGLVMGPFDEPLLAFTIALLQQEQGAPAAVATTVALVAGSGGLVAFAFLARRFEGADDDRLFAASALVMTIGVAGIAVLPGTAAVAVAAFVTAVGLSLGWLALQHRTLTLRPGEVGTTMAVISAVEMVGFVLPAGIGWIADRFDLTAALGAYVVLGLVLVASAMALMRSGR